MHQIHVDPPLRDVLAEHSVPVKALCAVGPQSLCRGYDHDAEAHTFGSLSAALGSELVWELDRPTKRERRGWETV